LFLAEHSLWVFEGLILGNTLSCIFEDRGGCLCFQMRIYAR